MSHSFNDHLDVCEQCRENPFSLCSTGSRALRDSVESGQGGEYDRTLNEVVNRSPD